jgi:serine/threonine protein kinase
MPLVPGTRLGVYEVGAQLGEGGMGEVYRATDTRLKRQVALKILPASFAADHDRLARFHREAEVLASLNHPHIAQIHGLEESHGVSALVMELVEGDDLSQRIARGAIPIDEALPIARQIAEALEAAHEQGIIHRDLKPANIKVRSDGTVKVLDFGLAKAMDTAGQAGRVAVVGGNNVPPTLPGQPASPGPPFTSPTLTSPVQMTGVGVILGTAAYMAPEQAKGRAVDKRADIWAFGCVLYEMLSGARPFDGEDTTDVLGAVVRVEPDWTRLSEDTPATVQALVHGSLVKDPRKRVGDMSAALFALDAAASDTSASIRGLATARRPGWWSVIAVVTALVAGLAVGAAAVWRLRPVQAPSASAPATRFVVATPPEAPFRASGSQPGIAISPDGSRIVYPTGSPDAPLQGGQLWIRDLDRDEPTLLQGAKEATGPFFSPDGQWVGYNDLSDGTLKRIPVDGGLAQIICTLGGARLRGASWGPDPTRSFEVRTASVPGVSAGRQTRRFHYRPWINRAVVHWRRFCERWSCA